MSSRARSGSSASNREPDWRFAAVYAAACLLHLVLVGTNRSAATAFVKALPILMLLAWAARRAPRPQGTALVLGLLCSASGDVILELSPQRLFIYGVAAFLFAHVFYIVAFWPDVRYSNRRLLPAAAVVAWCTAVAAILFPALGPMTGPVAGYMVVITAMGISAAFTTRAPATLFAGACSFILSDSLLALDKFVAPLPYATYLVMVTYYLGQFLIVRGCVSALTGTLGNLPGVLARSLMARRASQETTPDADIDQ